ncbi:elongation factor P maturation arginine rhamnosyltransferase EarP [Pseudomonas sp. GD03842]|uniref:elongation factor P maturation arginine rhamnosyltransferase EarP n=1 Tax=Pseudomonas sp. GD03842 TaxID=2975385 RepID=UPI00244AFFC0|nr:elongation factor P maturation arginine rhamnosyltransferase EarP [Pseudomonas sp. GD03842]MDH0748160.1 elongation factor P maturation arginine rhamnosyltransferase EarP [Pseudomonas sp. GD03842]
MKASWDIFCTVVDNFGDVGVTWRLARQLVAEHEMNVRLWIDDLSAFVRLCPDADAGAAKQYCEGVEVRVWAKDWQPVEPADVVIEAFGCHLPPMQIEAMKNRDPKPLWLNLDYLSAEEWVTGCHGLPSLQSSGIQKFFFFPGFRPTTGGLLREAGLIEQRHAFEQDPSARQAFLAGLGIYPQPQARLMSLFAYEHPQLGSWLDRLAEDFPPTHLLVPEGRILGDVERWLGSDGLQAGALHVRERLTIQVLPFVRQEDYDRLLWCCAFNVVRGEDSFVRAQWAGRPMIWHIYAQDDDAHWAKLDAFLELYLTGLSDTAARALTDVWRDWNAGHDMAHSWPALEEHRAELASHAERWCLERALQDDLTTALVHFYRNWL